MTPRYLSTSAILSLAMFINPALASNDFDGVWFFPRTNIPGVTDASRVYATPQAAAQDAADQINASGSSTWFEFNDREDVQSWDYDGLLGGTTLCFGVSGWSEHEMSAVGKDETWQGQLVNCTDEEPEPDCEQGREVSIDIDPGDAFASEWCAGGCVVANDGGVAVGLGAAPDQMNVGGTETGDTCDATDRPGTVEDADDIGPDESGCYSDGTSEICQTDGEQNCGTFGGAPFCTDQLDDGDCTFIGSEYVCVGDKDRVGDSDPVPAPEDRPTDEDGNPTDAEPDQRAEWFDEFGEFVFGAGSFGDSGSLGGGDGSAPGDTGPGADGDGDGDGQDENLDICEQNPELCDAADQLTDDSIPSDIEAEADGPLPDEAQTDVEFAPDYSQDVGIPDAGECPEPQSLDLSAIGVGTITLSYEGFCSLAVLVRPVIVGVFWVVAGLIAVRGLT